MTQRRCKQLYVNNNSKYRGFGGFESFNCILAKLGHFDGYLAKRFNWHTRFGALIDPVADKLLVAGAFITLAYTQHIPIWLAAVVIFRDVVIVTGATAYNFIVKPVPGEPTRISKLNTALQLLFLLFVLTRESFVWPDPISITILGAAILVTVVISGVDYVWSWSRRAFAGV